MPVESPSESVCRALESPATATEVSLAARPEHDVSPALTPTPDDPRIREAYQMRLNGSRVHEIADHFRVTERTIHRWKELYIEAFRVGLENQPAANLIAEQIANLEEVERVALFEAKNATARMEKNACLRTALKAREQITSLLLATGVLPKQPERLYAIMSDEKRVVAPAAKPTRSMDDIKASIISILSNPRVLS